MLPYFTFDSIKIGFLTVHVWGIFAALGFAVGVFVAAWSARKLRLDPEVIYDISPYLIVASIVGARIVFFLENPWLFTPLEFFQVWNGGLAFHGGFIGAVLTFVVYMRVKKLDLWKFGDAFAPAIALGHAIGRVGCYLTGLHIGKQADVPWAVFYEGSLRHPTPLYELLLLVVIFCFLVWFSRSRISLRFHGFVFAVYVLLYSTGRFFIEFFRTDPVYHGFTVAQYITIALFIGSIIFISVRLSRAQKHHSE